MLSSLISRREPLALRRRVFLANGLPTCPAVLRQRGGDPELELTSRRYFASTLHLDILVYHRLAVALRFTYRLRGRQRFDLKEQALYTSRVKIRSQHIFCMHFTQSQLTLLSGGTFRIFLRTTWVPEALRQSRSFGRSPFHLPMFH